MNSRTSLCLFIYLILFWSQGWIVLWRIWNVRCGNIRGKSWFSTTIHSSRAYLPAALWRKSPVLINTASIAIQFIDIHHDKAGLCLNLSYHVLTLVGLLIFVAVIAWILLWSVVVSLLTRAFGVRMPLLPFRFSDRRRASQLLTFAQYVWIFGVLNFGCGMWMVITLWDYLDWKYTGGPQFLSKSHILFSAGVYLMAGLFYGASSWKGEKST